MYYQEYVVNRFQTELEMLFLVLRACMCRRSCAGALPPLPPLPCNQVPVIPWGFCPSRAPMCLCVPDLPSPIYPPNPGIIRSLVSLSSGFLREGKRPGRLHSLAAVQPNPPPPRYFAMTEPSSIPAPPSPLL